MRKRPATLLPLPAALALAAVLAAGLPRTAAAGWPYGNIGLNVDTPEAQLDVGGTTVLRGPCFMEVDGQRSMSDIFEEAGEVPRGFWWWSTPEGDYYGIGPDREEDDHVAIRGDTCVYSWRSSVQFKRYAHQHGSNDVYVGVSEISFTNCAAVGITNAVGVEGCNEAYVYLSNPDNGYFAGATLVLPRIYDANPVRLYILTYQHGEPGTLEIRVGQIRPSLWFSIASDDDMLVELLHTPPRGEDTCGRYTFIRAIDTNAQVTLQPEFRSGVGGRIQDDGGSL